MNLHLKEKLIPYQTICFTRLACKIIFSMSYFINKKYLKELIKVQPIGFYRNYNPSCSVGNSNEREAQMKSVQPDIAPKIQP